MTTSHPRDEGHSTPFRLPDDWTVEPATEADLDDLLAIEQASFTNPWTRQMFVWEMENTGVSAVHVLRTPEWRVAAFCMTWLVLDEVHVNNLAVRPEFRGRGAGRAILMEVFRLGRAQGARRATLEVRKSNAVALALYASLGFEVMGTRRDYYTNPNEDALILWQGDLSSLEDDSAVPPA